MSLVLSFFLLVFPLSSSFFIDSRIFQSLKTGKWIKLINGASNHDVELIRSLSLVYSLAGVDCIDIACDFATLNAAFDGISAAKRINSRIHPYLMISVSDDKDVHFRKVRFNPFLCPSDCPRPCERVCPASAIPPLSADSPTATGVIEAKCYGCGRCIQTCPLHLIEEYPFQPTNDLIKDLLRTGLIDAIEIHTSFGHEAAFEELWNEIGDDVIKNNLKILSISFPDLGTNHTIPFLLSLQSILQKSYPNWQQLPLLQIFQADGKPMTGDLGKGTILPSMRLANHLLENLPQSDHPQPLIDFTNGKQFIQLSGGVNLFSVEQSIQTNLRDKPGECVSYSTFLSLFFSTERRFFFFCLFRIWRIWFR
jgi:Fe-S-cluster-containing hydrogenase component 2